MGRKSVDKIYINVLYYIMLLITVGTTCTPVLLVYQYSTVSWRSKITQTQPLKTVFTSICSYGIIVLFMFVFTFIYGYNVTVFVSIWQHNEIDRLTLSKQSWQTYSLLQQTCMCRFIWQLPTTNDYCYDAEVFTLWVILPVVYWANCCYWSNKIIWLFTHLWIFLIHTSTSFSVA